MKWWMPLVICLIGYLWIVDILLDGADRAAECRAKVLAEINDAG